jgi:hypothetical protein
MDGESLAVGTSITLTCAGLVVLLYGEYAGFTETAVPVGGVVALAGVGILTAHVARLPDPEDGETGH